MKKFTCNQQDIKLGQFTLELDSVQRKQLNRNAVGLDEIPLNIWKTSEVNDLLFQYCKPIYN